MKYFPLYYCILLIFVISLNEKTTSSYFCEKIILWKNLISSTVLSVKCAINIFLFLSIIICVLYHILYFVRLTICLACKEQTFWIIDLVLDNYMTITWQLLDNYLTITWQLLDNYLTITWQLLDKYVTITWLLLENYLTITQQLLEFDCTRDILM